VNTIEVTSLLPSTYSKRRRGSLRPVRLGASWSLRSFIVRRAESTRTTFAQLPDPFEPLLGVWATGDAIEAVTDQSFFLLAPPL
jgi:hypothetical protein